jgi:hypothetical protein
LPKYTQRAPGVLYKYKNMDQILANILHEVGSAYNHRKSKLFTFSKILAGLEKKQKQHFVPPSRCSCLFFHFLSQEVEALKIKKLIKRITRSH